MKESAVAARESFYVIVGSSGGALIGLQFVVITLIAERRPHAGAGTLSAFGTPTVVHFAGALLLSAIMSAPWPTLAPLSIAIGMCGLCGLTYGALVIRKARRQTGYKPVWQDWIWYAVLPCVSYAVLTVTAPFLRMHEQIVLSVIALIALGLLLIGIHNAWDSVTHLVVSDSEDETTNAS